MPSQGFSISTTSSGTTSHRESGRVARRADGVRWAIVEYRPGAGTPGMVRNCPCRTRLRDDRVRVSDGRPPLVASAGNAFTLSPGTVESRVLGRCADRACLLVVDGALRCGLKRLEPEEEGSMISTRVAVDVGGTFTDICVLDEDERRRPGREGALDARPDRGCPRGHRRAGVDLREVGLFSHGTTDADERADHAELPAARRMVTTRLPRRDRDPPRYEGRPLGRLPGRCRPLHPAPRPPRGDGARRLRGHVLEPLDEDDAHGVVGDAARRGVTTVAVCFINSYANPAQRAADAGDPRGGAAGRAVSTSSEVLPEIFEHERFSTTVANAVLRPLVGGYTCAAGGARCAESRLRGRPAAPSLGRRRDDAGGAQSDSRVRLAASGHRRRRDRRTPHRAASRDSTTRSASTWAGRAPTSRLSTRGELRVTKEWSVEYGYPVCFPSIEVLTIGAGGGSIAWIDEAGSLRNGPQSAGAEPGPGRLRPRGRAAHEHGREPRARPARGRARSAARMTPRRDRAEQAIRRPGRRAARARRGRGGGRDHRRGERQHGRRGPPDLDPTRLRPARVRARRLRRRGAAARRGARPRADVPTVIVPPKPGITSALGCLLVDIRHDLATMFLAHADTSTRPRSKRGSARLEAEARERLATRASPRAQMRLPRSLDMRYLGQWRSLASRSRRRSSLDTAVARFHERHEREHSYRRDGAPVELYRLNVTRSGSCRRPSSRARRPAVFPAADRAPRRAPRRARPGRWRPPCTARDDLQAGAAIEGPCVIEQLDSTTFVPQDVTAVVDELVEHPPADDAEP